MSGTYYVFTGTPSDLEGGARFYTLTTPVLLNSGGVYAIFGANFGSANPFWNASGTHTDPGQAASFGGGSAITMGAMFGPNTDRGWFTRRINPSLYHLGGKPGELWINAVWGTRDTLFCGSHVRLHAGTGGGSLWCGRHWPARAGVCRPVRPAAAHRESVLRDDDKNLVGAAYQKPPLLLDLRLSFWASLDAVLENSDQNA